MSLHGCDYDASSKLERFHPVEASGMEIGAAFDRLYQKWVPPETVTRK